MRPLYAVAFAALLCAQPLAAQAAPRIAHKPAAGRPYSAAVQVGDMYWFAGKVGNTPETQALTAGRAGAETRNVMEAFKALMTELGLDFGDVVQATVYLVDIDDFAEMNQVYGEYFPTAPPARETVAVKDLVGGAALEISFVAVKR
jgi:2-iminobutanoate/2-iminopropanoate deaminase